MESYREFDAGPDPFGRTWHVQFKWLQTAISLRHSDSVDVKFILRSDDTKLEKTIALMHPYLLELSDKSGGRMTDSWCSRLAAMHLKYVVESAEDMDQDIVTVSPAHLAEWNRTLHAAA